MRTDREARAGWLVALCLMAAIAPAPARAQDPVVGRNWVQAPTPGFTPRSGLRALEHDGKLWVLGGNDGEVRTDVWSGDGSSWTLVADDVLPPREGFGATSYKGRLWIIGGSRLSIYEYPKVGEVWRYAFYGETWSADDATTWTLEGTTSALECGGIGAVPWRGLLWVTGGYTIYYNTMFGDWEVCHARVLHSDDALHWQPAPASSRFAGRRDHAMVVFNDRLWVIGGRDGTTRFNDIWSTADGVQWTSHTLNAEFTPRSEHACCVFDGRLWLIGGSMNRGVKSREIWSTADGIAWSRVAPDPPFPARSGHALVALGSRMYIIGGQGATVPLGDIWYTETSGAKNRTREGWTHYQ